MLLAACPGVLPEEKSVWQWKLESCATSFPSVNWVYPLPLCHFVVLYFFLNLQGFKLPAAVWFCLVIVQILKYLCSYVPGDGCYTVANWFACFFPSSPPTPSLALSPLLSLSPFLSLKISISFGCQQLVYNFNFMFSFQIVHGKESLASFKEFPLIDWGMGECRLSLPDICQ